MLEVSTLLEILVRRKTVYVVSQPRELVSTLLEILERINISYIILA